MPIFANITCTQGEDLDITDQVVTASGGDDPVTGWAISFVVQRAPDAPAELTLTTANGGITIVGSPDDEAAIVVPRASTLRLVPGRHVFEVRRTDSGSNVLLTTGSLVVRASAG